jgi:cyclase
MKRLVPSMLIDERGAWVTQRFEKKTYLGEPSNVVRIFNEMMADELSVTWIGRDLIERNKSLTLISSQASMPLTYGGGLDSLSSAVEITKMGFERVCLTSAVFEQPTLIKEIAGEIGRSSVVVRIPVTSQKENLRIWDWKNRKTLESDLESQILNLATEHIGELILVSVDMNGFQSGVDGELVSALSSATGVQKGYEGGVTDSNAVMELWNSGVDAVYSSSWLMLYGEYSAPLVDYPEFNSARYSE